MLLNKSKKKERKKEGRKNKHISKYVSKTQSLMLPQHETSKVLSVRKRKKMGL